MKRIVRLTEAKLVEIIHGIVSGTVNEQKKQIDPKRIEFFDKLAEEISYKIVRKKYFFGEIGAFDNANIIVTNYTDRNQAINFEGRPVDRLTLLFKVKRVEEDLYKNEKIPWTGQLHITANFVNGKISPNPLVELYPDSEGKTYFSNEITPIKLFTWDMVGGADLWSKALKVS